MSYTKMRVIIEMDNAQYKTASIQVINDTQKIEKQAKKSFSSMEIASKQVANKMRQHFSIGAMLGAGFGLANKAIGALINALGKGLTTAISKNKEAKASFDNLGNSINTSFENIANNALPTLVKLADGLNRVLDPLGAAIGYGNSKSDLLDTQERLRTRMSELKSNATSGIGKDGYWTDPDKAKSDALNKLYNTTEYKTLIGLEKEATRQLNAIAEQEKLASAEKQKQLKIERDKLKILNDEKAEKERIAGIDKEISDLDDLMAKAAKQKEENIKSSNDDYNASLQSISESALQMGNLSSETLQFAKTLQQTAIEAVKLSDAIKLSKENEGELKLSGEAYAAISLVIYGVVSNIAQALSKMNDTTAESERQLEQMAKIAEQYQDALRGINVEIEKQNAALGKQQIIENTSLQAIDDEIEATRKLVKNKENLVNTIKKNADTAKGTDITGLLMKKADDERNKKKAQEMIDYFTNDPLGQLANLLLFGTGITDNKKRLAEAEADLAVVNAKILAYNEAISAEGQLAGLDTEIFGLNEDINKLLEERGTLLSDQALATDSARESLLKAQIAGATTAQQEKSLTDELIKNIEDEIKNYEYLLSINDDTNEQLGLQTDIQEHLNQLAELRGTNEGKITDQIKKQIDMMKNYVSLGLDLENIRVVKQLTKNFASQGLSGGALGGALADVGVSNRSISGRTLNIYGDINNTLNQATTNQSIASLNNIINSLGGI